MNGPDQKVAAKAPATPVEKSCNKCPSFIKHDDVRTQIETFGMVLQSATCARKSKLLSGPHVNGEERDRTLQAQVARTCDAYMKPVLSTKVPQPALSVALGMPGVPDRNAADPVAHPTTCRSCEYFVPAKDMIPEIGMATGFCAKRGLILSEQKTTDMARKCDVGAMLGSITADPSQAESRLTELLADTVVLPELRPVLRLGDKIGANIQVPVVIVDPQDYPTDAPVSDADKAQGIRAWRKVESGDGSRHAILPIFDLDFFKGTEDLAKIPRTGDDNHPELYEDHGNLAYKMAAIWAMGETPALHGVAGTGKTEAYRFMAWLMSLPFERVSITASTEIDELAGKTHYKEGLGTFFVEGRIPRAWAKPCVQVIDEPNVGGPEVWQFIRPMTDNAKQLVLDMNEGQVVARHPYSYLGMAQNPSWDSRNIGAHEIADADGSRLMHIFVDFPSEKLERKIIADRCKLDGYTIQKDELSVIMAIAKSLRELSESGTLPISWGIRQQIKVARSLQYFSMSEAYRLAAADYLEPEARELILDTVNMKTTGKGDGNGKTVGPPVF